MKRLISIKEAEEVLSRHRKLKSDLLDHLGDNYFNWLKTPNKVFSNKRPLDMMRAGDFEPIERMMNQLDAAVAN